MSNVYNLDEIGQDGPTIIIDGNEYTLMYPTMEQIENVRDEKDEQKQNDALFDFVVAKNDGVTPFKDVLKRKNLLVLKKFANIVKDEFGMEQ